MSARQQSELKRAFAPAKVEELEATVTQLKTAAAQQQKDFTARLKEQDAKIQKVNDKGGI